MSGRLRNIFFDHRIHSVHVNIRGEVSIQSQGHAKIYAYIRLAATRVGHQNGWYKNDEQYPLKKERYRSSSWGTADYELWVTFINTPIGLAKSQIFLQITVVALVSILPFQSVQGLEPMLVMMSPEPSLSSLPTI